MNSDIDGYQSARNQSLISRTSADLIMKVRAYAVYHVEAAFSLLMDGAHMNVHIGRWLGLR